MPRGLARDHEAQRERILAQAAAAFARQGYTGTSMSGLAQACGLSKATLYHYSPTKEALLEQVACAHMQRLLAIVRAPAAPAHTPAQRLQSLIESIVAEYADAQDAHRVLTEDIKHLPSGPREALLDQQREVVAVMSQAVCALRPDLAAAALEKPLTMLLFGMVNWMFTWVRPGGRLTHRELAPLVSELFLGGLLSLHQPPNQ